MTKNKSNIITNDVGLKAPIPRHPAHATTPSHLRNGIKDKEG